MMRWGLIQWRYREVLLVDDLFMLSEAQMRRIAPYFPLSHGIPRVDDRLIVSAIIFVIKNGLRWRDAPRTYGPHKTIYNRFIRWSRLTAAQLGALLEGLDWRRVHGGRRPITPQIAG